jgi:hypothetical protein
MVSNGETVNMIAVDPEKLWNFVVYTFLFEIILSMKFKFNISNLEFKFHKWSQMEKVHMWKL